MLLDNETELRATLRDFYGDDAGDEYDQVTLSPPECLVVDDHLLDLGDRGVKLTHFGRGHTGNDLTVAVVDGDVVFAGDLLEQSGPPAYGDDCYPLAWPTSVQALIGVDASTFVPGHGDVMTVTEATQQSQDIAIVAELIRELHAACISAEDALNEGGERWPYPTDTLVHAVERGYTALS
jgi:glyoxylase-like metal-dependent hydrolase (beta-lactamase superfamily II)